MASDGPAEAGLHVLRWRPASAGFLRRTWGPALAGPCLAIALAATGACRREAPKPAEREDTVVPVGASAAQKAAIRAVLHVTGVVVPAQGGEFLVLAPEPTRLVDVLKSAGDPVKTGDVLARFDLPSAAQTVSRLTADLAAAEAQVESARINRDKVRGFVERGLVARRELETADRELADAQGVVDRARTTQSAAQAGAVRAVVRAPFDGVVATRFFNPGDMVLSTTAPILRIVDPRRLEIVASVPRKDQSRVVTGATARVAAAGPEPVRLNVAGRVTDLSAGLPAGALAKADLSTGLPAGATAKAGGLAKADDSVAFRLVFVEPSTLAVDTPVQLDIDAEERTDTVLVPTEALVRDGTNTAVFVVNESRAQRRLVKTGIEDEARIEIIEGLRAGELVITRGHIGLTDGSPITVALDR